MNNWRWRRIERLDRASLHEARLQAHHALQWLARFARGFVPAKSDDSHTNLGWDDSLGGFSTHAASDGRRLALRVSDLSLVLGGAVGYGPLFRLDGCTDADVRAWLGREIVAHFDAKKLDEPSPYEIPAHAISKGASYSASKIEAALGNLADWFANANGLLTHVRQQLLARGLNPPNVRCWPHHFDLDSLISLGGDKTTGMGFSPGDEYYDEPYFYVTIYPEPEGMTLPEMPPIGHTHAHEFLAAIALSSRIIGEKDQGKSTEAFLLGSVDSAIKLLR